MTADRPNPEPLARVLEASERFIAGDGLPGWRFLTGGQMAERILADPGPLLAALAEAGVLIEQRRPFVDGGPIDGIDGWERRYVTAWEATEGFPDRLPEDIPPTRCHWLNPCPDRPRRRLRRFTDSPWRCPQCSRWWVTVGEEHSSISVTWTTWTWVRAEAKR